MSKITTAPRRYSYYVIVALVLTVLLCVINELCLPKVPSSHLLLKSPAVVTSKRRMTATNPHHNDDISSFKKIAIDLLQAIEDEELRRTRYMRGASRYRLPAASFSDSG